jgi:alanyl aminopeptidase
MLSRQRVSGRTSGGICRRIGRKLLKTLFAAATAFVSISGIGISSHAQVPTPTAADAPPLLRVSDGARPTHYELTLTIIPGDAKAPGEIVIDVELDRPHPVLWLNADEVTISRVSVSDAATEVTVLPGTQQFVGLAFNPALSAGRHRLILSFEAEQARNSTRGIFALQDGGDWYTMTQFEPVSARRAFPCFDEPGFKAPWQLTLHVPRPLVAVSNTPVSSETDLGDGMKAVRFAETHPLPSYLVAFAVGPWQTVDLGRFGMNPTPMRIIVPRGRRADAAFVSHVYPQILERLERWFGLAYPYTKLDHIAIPLTVGFAMENAGLITYAIPTLLAKPDASTPRFRHGSASVGAHEMAHQWFGNMVTAAWWDDIWLNEAFATWFAAKMVDQWQPTYEHGAGRSSERAEAINEDMLASARRIREAIISRGDIFNAFDSITYQKGATVIGMFEGWIGEAPFQRGVRRYLESRRDGNATVDDFLGALATGSKLPVAPAFSTFLDQNGVPQVDVKLQCGAAGTKLALSQHRLTPLGTTEGSDQRWQIPVCVRYGTGATTRQSCTLLAKGSGTVALQGGCPAFVFANAGGRGYYVADYRDGMLARLAADRNQLSPPEYASLLYDIRELVRAGSLSGAQALEWVRAAGSSHDRHVFEAAIELATFVRDTLVADAERAQFAAFVRQVLGDRARRLAYAPRQNESDDDQLLRRSLLRFVGPMDSMLAAEARRLAVAWIGDRNAIDPGMVDSVLLIAAQTGDAATFDALLAEAKATSDSLDRRNLMVALLAFTDPALARRGLAIMLDPAFDIRESGTALRISNYAIPPRRETHDFIVANFDAMAKRVSSDTPGNWPSYAAGLCSESERAKVAAFWRDRIATYAGGERTLKQALEQIQLCTRLRAAQGKAVAAFLARR